MNGQEWCAEYGVTFDWSAEGYHLEDGWEHQRFTVSFTTKGETIKFKWRQGLGIDHDPDVSEVLDALRGDAVSGVETFNEFCGNFGYDADSRKAHKVWKACGKTARKFERFSRGVQGMLDDFYSLNDGDDS